MLLILLFIVGLFFDFSYIDILLSIRKLFYIKFFVS